MLPIDGLDFSEGRASSQERVLEQFTPREAVIPMLQHFGTPAALAVQVDTIVSIGQMIGKPTSLLSATVHASISGIVTEISKICLHSGITCDAVHIRNDLKRRMDHSVQKRNFPENLAPKELRRLLLYSGIVGMGGEGFPTSAKCNRAIQAKADTLLVNGLQSEPYLHCDVHLLREHADRVIQGAAALSGVCRTRKIVFCLQDNRTQEIDVMKTAVERFRDLYADRELSVAVFKSRFPQGYEKLLIQAMYHVELNADQYSEDTVGAVVFNVSTCAAFWDMVERNLPCTSRVITIAGDRMSGHNVLVPIGTLVSELLERIPGVSTCNRIVLGGALTGVAIRDMNTPVLKTTTGITLIKNEPPPPTACLHCGECVDACPAGLIPYLCKRLIDTKDKIALSYENIDQCISCGACSYVCPAGIDLSVQIARAAHKVRNGGIRT